MTSPIQPIRVESILVDGRLRKLRAEVVDWLVESIGAIGLIHPLTIRRPNGQLVPHLVAGWHRLEAVKRLGWELVPCCTLEADNVVTELTEIDENLVRAKLSSAERGRHMGERQVLYEALHPETKHGTNRYTCRDAKLASFQDDTASKTGRSARSVARDAHRWRMIPRLAEVVGTCLDRGAELDALARLHHAQQGELIDRARAGEEVSAKRFLSTATDSTATDWAAEVEWHENEFSRVRQEALKAWEHWVACEPARDDVQRELMATWRGMLQASGLDEPFEALVAEVAL
jgi:hypothetical protein